MKISQTTPIEHIAALVCKALRASNITAVLVGGAVVSIYSNNQYESYDLDFVVPGLAKDVSDAMTSLGFNKEKSKYWTHPNTPYYIEFPGSVVTIGSSTKVDLGELNTSVGVVKLLTPTSSVMDRLSAYYYWDDKQCLEQAILVALQQPVELKKVEQWSKKEGEHKKYLSFLKALKSHPDFQK